MIDVSGINVDLGGRPVLADVSLSVAPREFIALVGPNGAGKSTLLRVIAGLLAPHSGKVAFGDADIASLTHRERALLVAWLPQVRPVAWNLIAEDLVALGRFVTSPSPYDRCGRADRSAIDDALERAGATPYRHRPVHTLSGGEQARLHLARTLATSSRALLLDEPGAALDIAHRLSLMKVLQDECAAGRAVVAAVHDLDLASRFCSRIIVLDQGHVVADGAPDVALDAACLARVFAVRRNPNGVFEPAG
ncbi:ABC transporter ATP-binding protein [Hyphomonas sp.]|jgi:iron complex transport system ATP-binding protein|uniref:ABC transporter ATP-binding protein n=1 Tax=Hyphomonas sp. TaxID=87 RepID=UPI0039E22F40